VENRSPDQKSESKGSNARSVLQKGKKSVLDDCMMVEYLKNEVK